MLASQPATVPAGSGMPADDIDARLAAVVRDVPGFGSPTQFRELPGGLTNRNFAVTDADGARIVVRLSEDQSGLLGIDRAVEHRCAVAAAAAGVAPAVRAWQSQRRALVVDWVDGRTLTPADLADAPTLRDVARACRALHGSSLLGHRFDMFALQRRYLDLVVSHGFRLPARYLDHMAEVDVVRRAMQAAPEPLVPCHNDLLAANVIVDELRGAQRVWLIDFEYAGDNEPSFELGNIWSEAALAPDWLDVLVAGYYGAASPARVARARMWGLMAKLGWTLWASIQAATSRVAFDFWSWGLEKYDRAEAELASPDLARLIADLNRSGLEGDRP
jgi:thiamine kinase-like enzyme